MRLLLSTLVIAWMATSGANATEALQRVYAERVALLAVDQRCALFSAPMRAALQAGVSQGRNALLRAGWTNQAADRLAGHARSLMAHRACTESAVAEAAQSARAGFSGFQRLAEMRFPGDGRTWIARRRADPAGWLAYQDLDGGRFGLRMAATGPEAAFALPLADHEATPAAARLVLRDGRRAPVSPLDIPGRTALGFAHNAPHPAMAAQVMAKARTLGPLAAPSSTRAIVFSFPRETLERIASLDPREAAIVEMDGARGTRRFFIEVGDLSAALAFLRAAPG